MYVNLDSATYYNRSFCRYLVSLFDTRKNRKHKIKREINLFFFLTIKTKFSDEVIKKSAGLTC